MKQGWWSLLLLAAMAGEVRSAETLRFEGATNFTGTALQESLRQNLDYQVSLVTDPASVRAGVVERLLLAGYLREGFPDAKVSARAAPPETIVVNIAEGPRYFCGQLMITGALHDVSSDAMRLLMLPPTTNSHAAMDVLRSVTNETIATNAVTISTLGTWKQEEGAPFDRWTKQNIQASISNAFAQQGHFFPRFTFEVRRRPDTPVADLMVNVTDEGPAMNIGEIVVQGAASNTAAEIRTFLGLSPGDRFSSVELEEKRQRLLKTGRLIDVRCIPSPPDALGRSTLFVKIVEVPDSLPLRVAPSNAESVLLKLADWLANWKTNDLDLAMEYETTGEFDLVEKGTRLGGVISPQRGFVATISAPKSTGGHLYGALLGQAHGETGIYLPSYNKYLSVTQFAGRLQAFINLKASPPDSKGMWKNSLIGVGFKSSPGPVAIEVNVTVDPAVLADLAYVPGSKITMERGIATFESPSNYVLKVEERTGRLIELRGQTGDGRLLSVKVDSGAFDRAVAAIKRQNAGWANVYDAAHPFGSFVAFAAPLLLKVPGISSSALARVSIPQWQRASDALEKVLAAAASGQWDVLTEDMGSTNASFRIPWGASQAGSKADTGMFGMIASFVLANLDQIAPEDTWAATCTRAQAFRMCGQSRLFAAAMTSIARDEQSGPLALAQCAALASDFDPRFARYAATLALSRSSSADFARDIGPLLRGDTLLNQIVRSVAHALADWSREDLDAVTSLLPADQAKALRNFVTTLQSASKSDFDARLMDALTGAWDAGLRTLNDQRTIGIRNNINAAVLGIPAPCPCLQMPAGIIDLGGSYNRSLKAVLSNSPLTSNVVAQLASNVQVVAGHAFDVRGLVLTAPPGLLEGVPSRIDDLFVGRSCKRLYFLHGASTADQHLADDENVAEYVVHYADDSSSTIDVISGRDISNSILRPGDQTTRAGTLDIADAGNSQKGTRLRLYVQAWENPHPEKVITSIHVTCWHPRAAVFLAGITAEP